MKAEIFSGAIPALMTPCKPDRTPDFDGLVRKGKELVAAGMSAVVYCGSMGDWPLLTDAQRMEGVERLVQAGIKVIVGTGAVNTAVAVAHAAHAAKVGAHGLMVIPRVLSRGPSMAAQRNHFKSICLRRQNCLPSSTTAHTMASPPGPTCSFNSAPTIRIWLGSRNSVARKPCVTRRNTSPRAILM